MSTLGDVASWMNLGRDVALAADQSFTYGATGASPVDMAKDSATFNSLNGSGAVDPSGQINDAATRSPALNAIAGYAKNGPPWWAVGAAIGGILILALIFRRR